MPAIQILPMLKGYIPKPRFLAQLYAVLHILMSTKNVVNVLSIMRYRGAQSG